MGTHKCPRLGLHCHHRGHLSKYETLSYTMTCLGDPHQSPHHLLLLTGHLLYVTPWLGDTHLSPSHHLGNLTELRPHVLSMVVLAAASQPLHWPPVLLDPTRGLALGPWLLHLLCCDLSLSAPDLQAPSLVSLPSPPPPFSQVSSGLLYKHCFKSVTSLSSFGPRLPPEPQVWSWECSPPISNLT